MPVEEILSDLSEPSSPESEMYDASEILGTSVHDEVTHQLAASGTLTGSWYLLKPTKQMTLPHPITEDQLV